MVLLSILLLVIAVEILRWWKAMKPGPVLAKPLRRIAGRRLSANVDSLHTWFDMVWCTSHVHCPDTDRCQSKGIQYLRPIVLYRANRHGALL